MNDPFERELPLRDQFRVTDGEQLLDIDSSSREWRDQYRQRYRDQAERLKRLCDELGLFLIEVATDADMMTVLKTGLGMRQR